MLPDHVIRKFTSAQRDMLIDHIDGAVEVFATHLVQARLSLLRHKLLRPHPAGAIRPRQTTLTEEGRRAVGLILGDCADVLVRAGIMEQSSPMQALLALTTAREADEAPAQKSALRNANL